jgi:hypothetical protein
MALMVNYQLMAHYPRRVKTSIELQWKPKTLHEQIPLCFLVVHISSLADILAAENALLNMLQNALVFELLIT